VSTPSSGQPETAPRDPRQWDDAALQRALDRAGDGTWGPVAVLPSTGSTNADAVDQVGEGAPEGFTVVADEQTLGRGRLDRTWVSPYGAGLAMSVVLRPVVPEATWGWIPLVAGLAVVDALADQGLSAALKWPNDVVVDGDARDGSPGPRKLGGLLVERVGAALVVGIGVNVDLAAVELPVPRATSTRLEGADVRREQLLVDVLVELRRLVLRWRAGGGDARRTGLRDEYAARCLTLGRRVRALLPGGDVVEGVAESVDDEGRLVVRSADGTVRVVSAGDVAHLR
jgi:BirA family transcriptional regulator, biotin operon repressor / biotin---[acetyl-CoA-carboxylase] ligase